MNSYERVYNLILEDSKRSNPQLDYILKSKENVMSGATRTLRRGLRKAKDTGKGNAGEDVINDVPKKWGAMMRRGRKARQKGKRRDFVKDVTP